MNLKVHGLFCVCGGENDAFDQLAGFVEQCIGWRAGAHTVDVHLQVEDDAAVFVRRGWMERDRFVLVGGCGQAALQFSLFGFHHGEARDQGRTGRPLDDGVDDALDAFCQLGKAALVFATFAAPGGLQAATRLVIGAHVFGQQLGIGKVLLQRDEHPCLDMLASHSPVVGAIAAFAKTGTAQSVITDDCVAGAAAAAFQQAGQQMSGLGLVTAVRQGALGLPSGRFGKGFGVDDRQLWRRGVHPFGFGIEPRDAFAGRRVFDEALPVPDDLADIEPVLQQAILTSLAAVKGGGVPLAAARAGNAFGIERRRDRPWRLASDIVGKYPAHDGRLALIDSMLASCAGDGVIAIGLAAAGCAGGDPR